MPIQPLRWGAKRSRCLTQNKQELRQPRRSMREDHSTALLLWWEEQVVARKTKVLIEGRLDELESKIWFSTQ